MVRSSVARYVIELAAAAATGDTTPPTIDERPFDQEFNRGYYLIHLLGTSTMDGFVEKDVYILHPEPPVDGWFLTADGMGGTFNNKGDSLGGPFTTPRQVCAAASGLEQQKFDVENRSWDCTQIATSDGGGGGIGMPGILGLAGAAVVVVVGAPLIRNTVRNRPRPRACEALAELEKEIAEYERADALIGEIQPKIEAADHLKDAPSLIRQSHSVLDQCEFSCQQFETRQRIYSFLFGWCETAQSLAGKFVATTSIALGFTGAIGWSQVDATGKGLTRLFIRLGIAGNRVKQIAGLSSFAGATLFGVITAANTWGPEGRASLAALRSALADTKRQLAAYEAQVTPVLEAAEEARSRHGSQRLTVLDQEQRRRTIDVLRARVAAECPGVTAPNTDGLPPVRGLEVGWQGRWEPPVMGAR